MKEHDLVGGGVTKQWLACFEQLRSKVKVRKAEGNNLTCILDCVYFRTFPFLVDSGTGIPIKNGLSTLRKRSVICVAHAKQDKTVMCKILFFVHVLCFHSTKMKIGS